MINRVLIRIKVVQMLYSYLLTRGEFKLQPAPEGGSRDKRFAYQTYVDILLMIIRLSGTRLTPTSRAIAGIDDNRYLPNNHIVKMLRADDELKAKGVNSDFSQRFDDGLLEHLYGEICRSAIYRSYIRLKNRDLSADVTFWTTIIRTVFAKDAALLAALRSEETFSVKGFEEALDMAATAVEDLGDISGRYASSRKALDSSLDRAYDLYHRLLALPVELVRVEEQRLDANRHKYLATADDLNPDTRFVDNLLVKAIAENSQMEEYLTANPFSWNDDPVLVRSLLNKVLESDIYKEYMAAESTSMKQDCEFWRNIFKFVILPSDDLAEALEDMSVYWNDDLDIVGTFVVKTMRRLSEAEPGSRVLLPQFKDDEDAAFGAELFEDTIKHFDEYRSLIDRFIDSRMWDSDRMAFMDVVIMATAISELLNYPAIPIAVTLNEYIEIANCYSTPKSGQFVNGILYSVINYLREQGKLNKK